MSDYYQHKPSWRANSTNRTNAPTMDLIRSPSGEWVLAPAPSRRGSSVPDAGGKPRYKGGGWTNGKISVPGLLRRAKLPLGFAGDVMRELMDGPVDPYTWDDFKDGKLPPPFDWLNYVSPKARDMLKIPLDQPMANQTMQPPSWMDYKFSNTNTWLSIPMPPGMVPNSFSGNRYTVTTQPLTNSDYSWLGWSTSNRAHPGAVTHPGWLNKGLTANARFWVNDRDLGAELDWIGIAVTLTRPASWVYHVPDLGRGTDAISAREDAKRRGVGLKTPMPLLPYTWHTPNWLVDPLNDLKTRLGDRVPVPPSPVDNPKDYPTPPGPGEKEKKGKVNPKFLLFAQSIFHGITEYQDALDALHDALPKKYQAKSNHILDKSLAVWKNLEHVDVGDAIVNMARNQFEDYVLGKGLFGLNQRAAEARGDRYGFRTLNSANNVGGIEELGEAYGDFSKEYINPSKDNLKRWLSDNYGI